MLRKSITKSLLRSSKRSTAPLLNNTGLIAKTTQSFTKIETTNQNRLFSNYAFQLGKTNADEAFVNSRLIQYSMHETDSHYEYDFELPGARKKDVHLEYHQRTHAMMLSAEIHKRVKTGETGAVHVSERHYGIVRRTIHLPADADDGKIEVSFEHGVLHLTVPKSASANTKKIDLKD